MWEVPTHWEFGFQSRELYLDWFKDVELPEIFILNTYLVPKNAVVFGTRQCVFDPDRAIKL